MSAKVASRPSRADNELKAAQEQAESLKSENEALKSKVEKLAFHLRQYVEQVCDFTYTNIEVDDYVCIDFG
jgi:cell division protein FtsB